MTKRIIFLVIVLIFVLAKPVLGNEPGNGVIEGQIINGTAGGSIATGVAVQLRIYQQETESGSYTAETNSEGKFVFTDLSTTPDYYYEAIATFQGVEYQSEPVIFTEGETRIALEITVYNTTANDENITVVMSHTILYAEENSFLVKEYYLFVNENDRTYIGPSESSDNGTLLFSLPPGATDLQTTMGLMECCIVIDGNDFVDTMPVLPGMHEVAYSYRLNQITGKYVLNQKINYPTNRYDLLFQGEDVDITCDRLLADDPMDINGIIFTHLSGEDLPAAETLVINFTGLSPAGNLSGYWLVLLIILVIIAPIIVFYLFKKKRLRPAVMDIDNREKRLLDELARLDDNFKDGMIAQEDYQKFREEKKAELMKLMQDLKED